MEHPHFVVAITGNCQTGNDILFKRLTCARRSGQNALGPDISYPSGSFRYSCCAYEAVELPGTPSLSAATESAGRTVQYLCSGRVDMIAVTGRALHLERLLNLLREILRLDRIRDAHVPVILCVSRCEEARQRGVSIDFSLLHDVLQIPVVPLHGFGREQLDDLKAAFHYSVQSCHRTDFTYDCLDFSPSRLARECTYTAGKGTLGAEEPESGGYVCRPDHDTAYFPRETSPIAGGFSHGLFHTADAVRSFLLPVLVLWLTVPWAGRLTDLLWPVFFQAEENLAAWALYMGTPLWLAGCMVHGAFRAASWIILILLPLLALFFTLLEFREHTLRVCRTKPMALPLPWIMAGYTALALQSFFRSTVGRALPVLNRFALAAVPAGILTWILGNVSYTGAGAGYLSLLPPGQYSKSLLWAAVHNLEPAARLIGLDGVILASLLLGYLAHELMLPILLTAYLQAGPAPIPGSASILRQFLAQHNWTWTTVLCTAVLTFFCWPCTSACLAVSRQTGSSRWAAAARLIPACLGGILCAAAALAAGTG